MVNQAPVVSSAGTDSLEVVTDLDTRVFEILRGASSIFSVVADDDDEGEAGLSYTWSVIDGSPVFFSPNRSNGAKSCEVVFEAKGDHQLGVSVRDSGGLTATRDLDVRVIETASGLSVSPPVVSVVFAGSEQFSATISDQFGDVMTTQPPSFTWSVSGGGIDLGEIFSRLKWVVPLWWRHLSMA